MKRADDPYRDVPSLLLALEIFLRELPKPPQFDGEVSIGVVEGEVATWWNASFGSSGAQSSFSKQPSSAAAARLKLSARAAEDVLRKGKLQTGRDEVSLDGDPALLTEVISTLTKQNTALDVRKWGR